MRFIVACCARAATAPTTAAPATNVMNSRRLSRAVRNCTRDGGGALRGRQSGADLKPPQAAVVKSDGGERCGNVGT